jgi:hypothetical protein
MLTLKPHLYLVPAVALVLVCFAANAEARGGSHGSGMHSLGRPAPGGSAAANATAPMPGRSAALPAAVAGSNARANALLTAPAAAVVGGVTASTPGASLASPGITSGTTAIGSSGADPAATTAATAASAGAGAVPALSGPAPAVAGPAAPAAPEPALPALSPMSDPLQTQFATGGGSGAFPVVFFLQSERIGPEQPRRWRQIASGLHGFLGCRHPHDKARVACRLQTFDGGVSRR